MNLFLMDSPVDVRIWTSQIIDTAKVRRNRFSTQLPTSKVTKIRDHPTVFWSFPSSFQATMTFCQSISQVHLRSQPHSEPKLMTRREGWHFFYAAVVLSTAGLRWAGRLIVGLVFKLCHEPLGQFFGTRDLWYWHPPGPQWPSSDVCEKNRANLKQTYRTGHWRLIFITSRLITRIVDFLYSTVDSDWDVLIPTEDDLNTDQHDQHFTPSWWNSFGFGYSS